MDELLDEAPCGYLALADDGSVRGVNATLLRMVGYERHELEGRHFGMLLSVSGRLFYQTHLAPALSLQGRLEEIYLSLRTHTGQDVPVLVNAVRRERGGITASEWVLVPMRRRDRYEDEILEARRAAEEAADALEHANAELEERVAERTKDLAELMSEMADQRQFLRRIIDTSPNLIFVKDESGNFALANQAVAALYGTTVEGLLGRREADVSPCASEAARFLLADRHVICTGEEAFIAEETVTGADGRVRWLQTVKRPLPSPDGTVRHLLGICTDITARKLAEEKVAHQALHDGLTGLPNRALFLDRLGRTLAHSGRTCEVAVLFVDLDNFKMVNDSLGHEAGDTLLREVAVRLLGCVRPGDTVARLGGDEFVLLLEEVAGDPQAMVVAERVSQALGAPLSLPGRDVFPRASIGVALSGLAETTPGDMLRDADTAMYHAKAGGKACQALFRPDMNTHALERLEMETELRRAIDEGQLRVHYQPIVQLDTWCLTGMEALVRWEHPVRGLVSPAGFIPVAEATGLILPLGWWVLHEACRQAAWWQSRYPQEPPLSISVNLSARQLEQPDLVTRVAQVMEESGLAQGSLKLEITESVMMADPNVIVPRLEALRARGVKLAVDDFGTGYSSMAYLSTLPLDTLKIDRSFVGRLSQKGEDQAIVRAIINMARALGLDVTSEGVETDEQLRQLQDMDCDRVQGYYFSRPLSEAAATLLISDGLIHRELVSDGLISVGPTAKETSQTQERLLAAE